MFEKVDYGFLVNVTLELPICIPYAPPEMLHKDNSIRILPCVKEIKNGKYKIYSNDGKINNVLESRLRRNSLDLHAKFQIIQS